MTSRMIAKLRCIALAPPLFQCRPVRHAQGPAHAFAQTGDLRGVMSPLPSVSRHDALNRNDAALVGGKETTPRFIFGVRCCRLPHKCRMNETALPLRFRERAQERRPMLVQPFEQA